MTVLGFLLWDLKQSRSDYEKRYEKELGIAFSHEKWQRRRLTYAWGAYHEKRYKTALKELGRLTARCDEDRRSVLLVTALCLTDLDREAEAEEVYRSLIGMLPEYATALSNLGLLLSEQGRRLEAEVYLLRAIRSDSAHAQSRHNLGMMYVRLGRYEEAIPLLEQSAKMLPGMISNVGALARCHAILENWSESRRWADIALHRGQEAVSMERALRFIRDLFPEPKDPEAYRAWKDQTGRESLVLSIGPRRRGRSYAGGEALGPVPTGPDGRPMRQLAAIFCEDFPGVGLPDQGLIRFFITPDDQLGMDPATLNVQRGFRVLYDREFGHMTPGAHPGAGRFPICGRSWLGLFARVRQPMPAWDYRFDREFGGEADEAFCRAVSCEFHRIGGYPRFQGQDPRKSERFDRYDQLLLQLDNLDWNGRKICMSFCIPSEKLAAGDFSDVLYWWD